MPLFVLTFLLAWPGPAERSEAVERVREAGFESELNVAPGEGPTSGEGASDDRRTRAPAPPPADRPPTGAASGLASVLLWVVIGLCLAALLIILLRDVSTRPARARAGPVVATAVLAPEVAVRAATLDDAEALAAAGRWAEAIHLLLLRTFADLGRQAELAPSLTSREILERVVLQPEAAAALRHLVVAVEVSLFGAAEPGAEDYARCRDSFRRLLGSRGVAAG